MTMTASPTPNVTADVLSAMPVIVGVGAVGELSAPPHEVYISATMVRKDTWRRSIRAFLTTTAFVSA